MDILHLPDTESFAAGIDVTLRFSSRELQKLDNFTIFFLKRGQMRLEVDFRVFDVKEGDTFGLMAGQFFQCLEAGADLVASYITFTPEIWQEVIRPFDPSFFAFLREYPLSPEATREDTQYAVLQVIRYIYLKRAHTFRLPIFKNVLQACLMDLYDKAKSHFIDRRSENTSRQEELFEQFIHLIIQFGGIRREVQFYAGQLCITTRYLSSVVQALTGHTTKEFIDERCIQEIKMQLRTTDMSIQEIAYRLNFPDQSFFSRYFRKHTGMTPVEYRKVTSR